VGDSGIPAHQVPQPSRLSRLHSSVGTIARRRLLPMTLPPRQGERPTSERAQSTTNGGGSNKSVCEFPNAYVHTAEQSASAAPPHKRPEYTISASAGFVEGGRLDRVFMCLITSLVSPPQRFAHQVAEAEYPKENERDDVQDWPGKDHPERERPACGQVKNQCGKKLHRAHRHAPAQAIPQKKPSMPLRPDAPPVLSLGCSHMHVMV
jgi:hypothetical protein